MIGIPLQTAAEAFDAASMGLETYKLRHLQSDFICPYPDCRSYTIHHWGVMYAISRLVGASTYSTRELEGAHITTAFCQSCERDVIFLDGKMVKPATSEAPPPAEDIPVEILNEYTEAAAILPGSPRGAAALLRLAVQKLLPLLGATKRDINDQIGELVAKQVVSRRVQQALDTMRVIGNEAVHPGTIDLKDDAATAMGLFRLLNFIIEKAISEPKHADEMFAKLPQGKVEAIARRDDGTESV
ncbi:DUF4145 domain-containing protein [Sphingomonas soli]|uniref:DUF4145 domain-containing protein n=1 Tax=Sphingomonas soli TaxID=266127 RepID=UPI000B21E379|nr:DUF4145 domain-containing protein [Sphingomonas soli]